MQKCGNAGIYGRMSIECLMANGEKLFATSA
jgi:hypothetical protein